MSYTSCAISPLSRTKTGICVYMYSSHLFQRSSSSPPHPQNALGNPLIFLNCLTVRPLTPPKNSLYGSLGGMIAQFKLGKEYIYVYPHIDYVRTHM